MENKLDKVVITWLNNKFGNLKPIVKGDKTFYINEDRIILFYYYQDKKNGYVYINYNEIWSFLESIFGLESLQIKGIITYSLEETYNLKGLTPYSPKQYRSESLEETYNLKGLTPVRSDNIFLNLLEETYNLKGLTPTDGCNLVALKLEETYNLNH